MMRILHVVPSYRPAWRYGGPIYSVHGLCAALARAGDDIHVFTTNADGAGCSDVPLEVPVDIDGVTVWYFPVGTPRRLFRAPAMKAALMDRMSGFDVVHLHSVYLWPTWAAARTAVRRAVPFLLAPRGMLVKNLVQLKNRFVKSAWIRLVERRTLREAAAIHCTSDVEASDLAAFGFALPPVVVVPNGVDVPTSEPARVHSGTPADEARIVYLGRITWKKGIDQLLYAMRSVEHARLVVAGNDEEGYTPSLRAIAERAGIADRVEFCGPLYGAGKSAFLHAASLLVLPSTSENFGNVVLEALAHGCPVVTTRQVGAGAVVTEARAGAVYDGCSQVLGTTIAGLLRDRDELRAMGARGRAFVLERYTWDAVARDMRQAYVRTLRPAVR